MKIPTIASIGKDKNLYTAGALFIYVCSSSTSMAQTAPSFIIDDFLVPSSAPGDAILPALPGERVNRSFRNVGALGGFREVMLANNYASSRLAQSEFIFNSTALRSARSGRNYGLSINTAASNSGLDDAAWRFSYGRSNSIPITNLLSYDYVDFQWEADHVALGNDTSVSLAIFDLFGNAHTSSILYDTIMRNPILTSRWDLSEFSDAGVDISAISRIDLFGDTDHAGDYLFSSFIATVAPEPSSTALLGLGFLSLMFKRKRV